MIILLQMASLLNQSHSLLSPIQSPSDEVEMIPEQLQVASLSRKRNEQFVHFIFNCFGILGDENRIMSPLK